MMRFGDRESGRGRLIDGARLILAVLVLALGVVGCARGHVARHRAEIEKRVATDPGWQPRTYDIELLADWNHDRVPILVVNTNTVMTDFAPLFAVLPGDRLVSHADKGALKEILDAYFPKPTASDAKLLAQLAVSFGETTPGVALGEVIEHFPTPSPPAGASRSDPAPTYARDGADHVIAFYAFEHERRRLNDCELRITPTGVALEHTPVELGSP